MDLDFKKISILKCLIITNDGNLMWFLKKTRN